MAFERFEGSVDGLERLGNGTWIARPSGRLLGRDVAARSCELRAGNLDALLDDIRDFFYSVVPAEVAPAKKRAK
jgi:hypothetical protein